MHRWRLPATLALTVGLATSVALAGCGSSSKSSTKKVSSTASTTVPLHTGNTPALRQYVDDQKCAAAPGGWAASGIATNPTNKTAKYKITVYFANSQGTIEGTGTTTVSVKSKKSAPWTTQATLTAPDPKTTCVLSGVAPG